MTESERIAQLTAAVQKGDKHAFEELYAVYGARIYYFCLCLMGEERAAVEVTRDVFLYAWQNLRGTSGLPKGQTFFRWMCGNAFYFAKIAIASQRGTGLTVEDTEADAATTLLFDSLEETLRASGLSAPELRSNDLQAATRLVSSLPDGDRLCVLLYAYAVFSAEEIAGIAGCSEEAVKLHIYNGFSKICEGFNEREAGSGDELLPFFGRVLRVCGKNCRLPEAVTVGLREGLAKGAESFEPVGANRTKPEIPAAAGGKSGPKLDGTRMAVLCTILALLLIGALAYLVHWFLFDPEPSGTSSPVGGTSSAPEQSVTESLPDESLPAESLPADESLPAESDESVSEPVSDVPSDIPSDILSDVPSGTTSGSPVLEPLPRATDNLRLRTSPDTSVTDNIVTMIPAGAHIEILETVTGQDGKTWYRAQYTNAAGTRFEGYCSADYVKTSE